MQRVTKGNLKHAVAAYKNALESLGHHYGDLHLQTGSKTNGNSYHLTGANGEILPGINSWGIGLTAREAFETIWTATRTMQDLLYLRQNQ